MPRRPFLPRLFWLPFVGTLVFLSGCEQLGIETPETIAATREADGKAIGGACRHAGRAIEDCYLLYKKVDRAAVFAGWRDMNDYMRENKIETVVPVMSVQPAGKEQDADEEKADAARKKVADSGKH